MKRLLWVAPLLSLGGMAWGAGSFNGLTVSSGTYQAISTYSNSDGGNRQSIIIGDRASSATALVDPVQGLEVYLGTSTANPIGSIANTSFASTQSGAWVVSPGTGVYRTDSSAVTQPVSGTFWQTTQPVDPSHALDSSLNASVSIKGSSNTVQASQSGAWSVSPGTGTYPVSVIGTVNVSGASGGGIIQQLQAGTTVSIGFGNVISSVPVSIQNASIAITGALTANQSVNVAQVNGANTAVSGTAGQQRVSVEIQGTSNTVSAVGNVAGGATDSGNPVKVGGIGHTTYQTAVTDGQRVDAAFDSEGKEVVMPYAIPALSTSGVTVAMTAVAENVLVSSGGSNINTYITGISCFNSHATVGTVINIRNGRTLRYTGYAVAAGGGFSVPFPTPLAGAGNSQWTAENVTTGSNTYCDAVGYFAKN